MTTEDIVFHAINFRALALFGETVFKYVTFQGYSHFREAVFKKGLNLEYANIEKEMNFFGIKENTNQETYRIPTSKSRKYHRLK